MAAHYGLKCVKSEIRLLGKIKSLDLSLYLYTLWVVITYLTKLPGCGWPPTCSMLDSLQFQKQTKGERSDQTLLPDPTL
jgi:hypothetical protein